MKDFPWGASALLWAARQADNFNMKCYVMSAFKRSNLKEQSLCDLSRLFEGR